MAILRKDTRIYASRAEYLKVAVTERRRRIKQRAIGLMGGACMVCGYSRHQGVLDFHHVYPATKSFGISSGGFSRSWVSIYTELQKCILVCANCHREIELGLHNQKTVQQMHERFWATALMDNSLAPGTGFEPAT